MNLRSVLQRRRAHTRGGSRRRPFPCSPRLPSVMPPARRTAPTRRGLRRLREGWGWGLGLGVGGVWWCGVWGGGGVGGWGGGGVGSGVALAESEAESAIACRLDLGYSRALAVDLGSRVAVLFGREAASCVHSSEGGELCRCSSAPSSPPLPPLSPPLASLGESRRISAESRRISGESRRISASCGPCARAPRRPPRPPPETESRRAYQPSRENSPRFAENSPRLTRD